MSGDLVGFHEDWYSAEQLATLVQVSRLTRSLGGTIVEIGCWEGRSTSALANACHPETVWAVDTWLGNIDEDPDHPSVRAARARDVYATFLQNVAALTRGNVQPIRADCHAFLASHPLPVKFCHIDASHDYSSVERTIAALLPLLVPGGVLCGDDFLFAHAGRTDLQGGVERAVRELLPGFDSVGNFWYWRRPPT
jgi:SAM-dependent methyltransferase